MKKQLVNKDDNQVVESKNDDLKIPEPLYYQNPFFNFRYSYTSISNQGAETRIQSKALRFENGKFESESFEGTASGKLYGNMIEELQDFYAKQLSFLLNPWSFFFSMKDKV